MRKYSFWTRYSRNSLVFSFLIHPLLTFVRFKGKMMQNQMSHQVNQSSSFILQKFISKYCGRIKKILSNEKRMCHSKTLSIEINDFPGGPQGFELVSRFCYNNGKIPINVSNVLILHCCGLYLGMTEEVFTNNLLQQIEIFLEGIHYWTWNEILVSLKN